LGNCSLLCGSNDSFDAIIIIFGSREGHEGCEGGNALASLPSRCSRKILMVGSPRVAAFFRRHYPVQVHGSLTLARQTLSVASRRFGSPNGFKLADSPEPCKRAAGKKNSPQACPIYFPRAK